MGKMYETSTMKIQIDFILRKSSQDVVLQLVPYSFILNSSTKAPLHHMYNHNNHIRLKRLSYLVYKRKQESRVYVVNPR